MAGKEPEAEFMVLEKLEVVRGQGGF